VKFPSPPLRPVSPPELYLVLFPPSIFMDFTLPLPGMGSACVRVFPADHLVTFLFHVTRVVQGWSELLKPPSHLRVLHLFGATSSSEALSPRAVLGILPPHPPLGRISVFNVPLLCLFLRHSLFLRLFGFSCPVRPPPLKCIFRSWYTANFFAGNFFKLVFVLSILFPVSYINHKVRRESLSLLVG